MTDAGISLDETGTRARMSGAGVSPRALLQWGGAFLAAQREAHRGQGMLWLVVMLGTGIGLYFALPFEPSPFAGAGFVGAAASLCFMSRRAGNYALALSGGLLALAVGFGCADLRAHAVAGPVLSRSLGPVTVEGRVIERSVDADGNGKLVLSVTRLGRLTPEETPKRVRVTVRKGLEDAAPEAFVRLTAKLMPPPGPAAPGAFDFARKAYFEGIGAVGFAYGAPRVLREAGGYALPRAIATYREALARRVGAAIPGPAGGIAVALMTGLRGAVPDATQDDLRASGLMHLLSISGLHVSLVALVLFGTVRLLLVLHEGLALRVPTKKWAAGATILGLAAYVELTGASIPAERAFIMSTLVLLAVILDRRALTLRNVALAGGVVLILLPESLLDVSFQMSFAATLALVCAFEAWNAHRRLVPRPERHMLFARTIDYASGLAVTSLVAGLATAPFSAYHFQTISLYGLISNMIAVPLTGILVMPALLAAYLLVPLGLGAPVLALAHLGLEGVVGVAHAVAGLPGAVVHVHAGPMGALVFIALGGLVLSAGRTKLRGAGLLIAGIGVVVWALARPPDVLIARDLETVAVKDESGALAVIAGKASAFDAAVWLKRAGDDAGAARTAEGLRCDALGCAITMRDRRRLYLSHSPASLGEDCWDADILISTGRVRRACAHPALIVDRLTTLRDGAIAIWSTKDGLRMKGAGGERDGRLWSPKRPVRTQRADVRPNTSG